MSANRTRIRGSLSRQFKFCGISYQVLSIDKERIKISNEGPDHKFIFPFKQIKPDVIHLDLPNKRRLEVLL